VFDKMPLWWFFGVLIMNKAKKKSLAVFPALFGESLDVIPQLLKRLPEILLPKTLSRFFKTFAFKK
jgi:hypothetical protein